MVDSVEVDTGRVVVNVLVAVFVKRETGSVRVLLVVCKTVEVLVGSTEVNVEVDKIVIEDTGRTCVMLLDCTVVKL